jgi:RNA polymerase sigma-70 factor (ECF subfamily)
VDLSEKQCVDELQRGNIAMYETVYKMHFQPLYFYAHSIVKDEIQAEEIVQQLFVKIWERKEKLIIETSLKAYLYKCIYHDSLNYLKHLKVKQSYEVHATRVMKSAVSASPAQKVMYRNLEDKVREALNDLPEQCRTVFQLSRHEELKYREIAVHLGISEKTVENHMGKALKLLRIKLAEFMISIVVLLIYFKIWLQ